MKINWDFIPKTLATTTSPGFMSASDKNTIGLLTGGSFKSKNSGAGTTVSWSLDTTVSNSPYSGCAGRCICFVGYGSMRCQLYIDYSDITKTYMRLYWNGSWRAWKKLQCLKLIIVWITT